MSGLARILAESGFKVSGSDAVDSKIVEDLRGLGIKVFVPQKAENVKEVDVFVYTSAIPTDNPEYKEAKRQKITMISRSELLGELMSERKGIAVAGTHGKTTTSTMLSLVFEEAGLNPTIVIGGEVKNIGGNAKKGTGEYFIAEACEYKKAFLDLRPFGAIITNIEADHLDFYKDLNDIIETFKKFTAQIDKEGFLVVCSDNKNMMHLNGSFDAHLITYGLKNADYVAKNIEVKGLSTLFEVFKEGKSLGQFKLSVPGSHNVLNALSVIATANYLGLDLSKVRDSLAKFVNAKRRYELKGERDGILVIDDYAHHPTEIQATLKGIKEFYPKEKIWVVFQPHQYSRTRLLFDDFAKSFTAVDQVITPEIYEVRDTEDDKKAISAQKLAKAIDEISHNAKYIGKFEDIVTYLKENVKKGDLVITLGAGPVYKVGEMFLRD